MPKYSDEELESHWSYVEQSMIEFNRGLNLSLDSKANKRFAQYFHWYYHPIYDFFAPSKFIGYWDSHEGYDGWGNGGQTEQILRRHFDKVPYEEFDQYYEKLISFANKYGRKISERTYTVCGIHIPNQKVMTSFITTQHEMIRNDINQYVSEYDEFSPIEEGNPQQRLVNKYERNPIVKMQALRIHGTKCMVCQFDYKEKYGKYGDGFIELHHKVPLSNTKQTHFIDPRNDVAVVCSNCHRMIHRNKEALSIEELMKIVEEAKRGETPFE